MEHTRVRHMYRKLHFSISVNLICLALHMKKKEFYGWSQNSWMQTLNLTESFPKADGIENNKQCVHLKLFLHSWVQ